MTRYAKFFEKMQNEYLSHLQDEHGIETAMGYFNHVDAPMKNEDAVRAELRQNDFKLEHLFQCLPMIDQDVVLLSSNPGLQKISTDIFTSNEEFGKNRKQTDDIEQRAKNLAGNLDGYLTKSNGFSKIIPHLQDGLSLLTSQADVEFSKYVQPEEIRPDAQNLFSEVYYSRIYKFPSENEEKLTTEDKEFGKQTFSRELERVDPRIIIATGKLAWEGVYEQIKDSRIHTHNDSHITSDFGKYTDGQARGGVYEIPDRDVWVITTRHGGYSPDTDRLQENINCVNQSI